MNNSSNEEKLTKFGTHTFPFVPIACSQKELVAKIATLEEKVRVSYD